MNESSRTAAWQMVETLTKAGLVVPPLGAVDPAQIVELDTWYWASRDLDRMHLYTFKCDAIARDIAQQGPAFALSHVQNLLSLVSTSPSGDIAVYTQDGGLAGGYADIDRERASINAAHLEIARLWAMLAEARPVSDEVDWLAYNSLGSFGTVDLEALRNGADFATAHERVEDAASLGEVVERCADKPSTRRHSARRGAPRTDGGRRREADPTPPPVTEIVPQLAEALRRLEDDAHLVISVYDSVRYVQFATFRPNLRLETIGTRYLEDAEETWSVEEVLWLADQGWHDADDGGNLWRHWIPADEDEAAAAAVEALVNVHGVTGLDQVWFQSEDDNVLAALEGATAPENAADPRRPISPGGLQPPATPAQRAKINAILNAYERDAPAGVARMPGGTKYIAVVDYIEPQSVLELLAIGDRAAFRRHDGRWYEDPRWSEALPKAPARCIVPLTQEQFDRVLPNVDASTAGQPWKPFELSRLEMYWPSHRPNDPKVFDWSLLDSLDDLREP